MVFLEAAVKTEAGAISCDGVDPKGGAQSNTLVHIRRPDDDPDRRAGKGEVERLLAARGTERLPLQS